MAKKRFKTAAVILSTALVLASLSACGIPIVEENKPQPTNPPASEQTSTYPLETDVTLTWWEFINSNVAPNFKGLGDTPYAKELERLTGVKIEYLHPPSSQYEETFNMMIASEDYPDIINHPWASFPGGPDSAIKNEVIIELNDVIDQYAPNLKKVLDANPGLQKDAKTDSGYYYMFPAIGENARGNVSEGPMARADWLKELGLENVETIDEWYIMLKGFKEKKNAEAPLTYTTAGVAMSGFRQGFLVGAFGVIPSFYTDDNGKVKFGPIEPGFKEFLTTMAKWYDEGLLDKNLAAIDNKMRDANIVNGKSGATKGYIGADLGRYLNTLKETDPNADMVPLKYPVLNKGDKPKFANLISRVNTANQYAISTKCKNVEIAAKLLDYGYTEEGYLLNNYGIEGTSYKLENGKVQVLDEVLKNPDNLPPGQAMAKYSRGVYYGPFIQTANLADWYYQYDQQKLATKLYTDNDAIKYMITNATISSEDSSKFSDIVTDINTHVQEYMLRVIMGVESADSFDKFVAEIKEMNIDKAIQIQQEAVDRYNNR